MFSSKSICIRALAAVGMMACLAGAQDAPKSLVVATVGNTTISERDLEAIVANKLLPLKTEEYNVRRAGLDRYIADLLLSTEAGARGTTVDSLIKQEVTDRISPVTETESMAAMQAAPATYEKLSESQALQTAATSIRLRRTALRREVFLGDLRKKYPTEVLLDAPRITVPFTGGESLGPAKAGISIIVFSDFQCPFCTQLSSVLDRILAEYPKDIHLTFKQFPLPFHPQAEMAAEAALCAGSQGRFWEMYALLFKEQPILSPGVFGELAQRADLDENRFTACVNSRQFVAEIRKDKADGASVGVSATPTMFINGQMIVGARSYEAMKQLIETELRRAANGARRTTQLATR